MFQQTYAQMGTKTILPSKLLLYKIVIQRFPDHGTLLVPNAENPIRDEISGMAVLPKYNLLTQILNFFCMMQCKQSFFYGLETVFCNNTFLLSLD